VSSHSGILSSYYPRAEHFHGQTTRSARDGLVPAIAATARGCGAALASPCDLAASGVKTVASRTVWLGAGSGAVRPEEPTAPQVPLPSRSGSPRLGFTRIHSSRITLLTTDAEALPLLYLNGSRSAQRVQVLKWRLRVCQWSGGRRRMAIEYEEGGRRYGWARAARRPRHVPKRCTTPGPWRAQRRKRAGSDAAPNARPQHETHLRSRLECTQRRALPP
jgi:hypothetical protein